MLCFLSYEINITSTVFLWLLDIFFYFQNNPKTLDLSYKDESRYLGLHRKGKTRILANFHRTYSVICSQSREGKPCLVAK